MTLWPTPRFTFRLDGKDLLDEPMDARCAGETTEFETNIGFHCPGQRPIDYEIRLDDIAVSFFP